MSGHDKTTKPDQPVWPYNPRHLQDMQDILDAERQREFDERERAFHETLTPEQKEERDEYDASIQSKKEALGIGADADVKWSEPDTPKRWAKVFDVSAQTFKRWVTEEKIRAKKLSDRRYQVDVRDLPRGD